MRSAASALGPASKRLLCNWHKQVPHQKPGKVLNRALNAIHQLHSWLCPLFVKEDSDPSIVSQLGTERRHLCLEWTDKHVELRKHFPSSCTKGIFINSMDSKCTEYWDHLLRTHAASSSCCWLRENKSFWPIHVYAAFWVLGGAKSWQSVNTKMPISTLPWQHCIFQGNQGWFYFFSRNQVVCKFCRFSFLLRKACYSSTIKVVKEEFRSEWKSYFNEVGQKLGVIRGQINSYCWELTYYLKKKLHCLSLFF